MANESASIQNEISNQIREQKQLRKVILAQQTKLKNFVTANLNNMSAIDIETRFEMMEKQFENFNKIQSEIERIDAEEINSSKRDTYEENFCLLKATLRHRLEAIRPQSTPIVPQHITAQQITERSTRVHLPNIQLPKFSGNYTEWLDFYSLFKTLIHDNNELNDVERFQHLKSCLIGAPANILQSLELTSVNYHNAIALLRGRYDNKRFIFQAHVEQIYATNTISTPTVSKLRNLVDIINGNYRAISSLGTKEQIGEGLLVHLAVTKLDMETRSKWEEHLTENYNTPNEAINTEQLPSWDDLAMFLEKRCQALRSNEPKAKGSSHHHQQSSVSSSKFQSNQYQRGNSSFVATESSSPSRCELCKSTSSHSPFKCTQFMQMNPSNRFRHIKNLKLCINCLKGHHHVEACKSQHKCQRCNAKHHTLLHFDSQSRSPSQLEKGEPSNSMNQSQELGKVKGDQTQVLKTNCGTSQVLLATALIHIRNEHGNSILARAILDSASQLNFITERVAQSLNLKRQRIMLDANGIGSANTTAHAKSILQIESLHNKYKANLEVVILPEISSHHPHTRIDTSNWKLPENIKLSDPQFNHPGAIDVLLGASIFFDILQVGHIKLGDNYPILQKTLLGWVVSGTVTNSTRCLKDSQVSTSLMATEQLHGCTNTNCSDDINNTLRKFWEVEEVASPTNTMSSEETECENFFNQTTTYCARNKRFTVRLPFREHPWSSLGYSYQIACNRLLMLEHKLSKKPELRLEYHKFLTDYKEQSHMRKLTEDHKIDQDTNYIPHHCVSKLDSSTTKLRVVFDASCQTTSGKSLNDILMIGPTLQDDIFTLLTRFRLFKIVLMADIKQMYRQVLVHSDDAKTQCILWRDDVSQTIQPYQLETITYGTSCAPYLAVRCLRKLAENFQEKLPLGSKITLRDFYVDNLMSGGETIEEVMQIKTEVTTLLRLGGFPLRKWATNKAEIIADIADEDREPFISFGEDNCIKALGMGWSPVDDSFHFNCKPQNSTNPSKRQILSQIAQFYDPLGLVNPLIVRAKIFLQTLWKLQLHWDESLPQHMHMQWVQFRQQLEDVKTISIPRYVPFTESDNQLHGFADASTKAYGACVYIRTVDKSGNIVCNLLCAKSRVAPIKEQSLPRLELNATLLLADLIHRLRNISETFKTQTFGWTDSTIALTWLTSEPCRWTSYVANRVSKIQSQSYIKWNHVSTTCNPADLVSRGTSAKQLQDNELWFHGPQFLQSPENKWPNTTYTIETNKIIEQKPVKTTLTVATQMDLLRACKFINDYNKLIRTFCIVRRFLTRNRNSNPITATEFDEALLSIIRIIQRQHFGSEIRRIQQNREVNDSKLCQLNPFLDNNVLRVGGRLHNSSLTFDAKHPILLPKEHPFTRTLIRYHHRKHYHAGSQTLHNILRERFWIIRAKSTIREVIKGCILCFRYRPVTNQQIMGSLPADRVTPSKPFSISGVDYCGPLLISHRIRGRAPYKVYVAIFVCFSTKAVHIEVVADLSTPAFIAALKRFVARRGKCMTIYSDNATNFVGANRQLKEFLNLFTSEQHQQMVQNFCVQDQIEWKYIPPRSPHFGGLWESAVKVAKQHLRKIIGTAQLTIDELSTSCCQIEAIMNSRPLTPASEDPNDLSALTPGHFLVGQPLTTIAEPTVSDKIKNHNQRYQYMQLVQQRFWKRWSRDYLNSLQQRQKWSKLQRNLKVNDLVLIKEDNVPPLNWPMGRIIKPIAGVDNRVRVALVRTSSGTYKRAITKLCLLPLEDQEVESGDFQGREDVESGNA